MMRVVVIYQEKKFIVVVPSDCSVTDLKTEIERVHCALFQAPGPPQPVTEVRTLAGCVLYGGYTVSSLLSDNDTVIASGADGAAQSVDSAHTQVHAYASQSPFSYYGYNPMDYHSPAMNMGAHTFIHSPYSPYTPPQSHVAPPLMTGASRASLFQSPSARTVGSQCPSPEPINWGTPQSRPHQSRSEGKNSSPENEMRLEEPTAAEESESPLGDLSHMQKKASQQKTLFSTNTTSTVCESSDSARGGRGRRKRKIAPRIKPRAAKRKTEEEKLEEGQKGKCVSTGGTQTALSEGEHTNLPPHSNTGDSSEPTTQSSTFSPVIHAPNKDALQDGSQSPQMKKKKLSENSGSAKKGKKEKEVQKVEIKKISLASEDSSDWTSSDGSDADAAKKKPSSSKGKTKPVAAENVSKSKNRQTPVSANASSSEWESDDDKPSTAQSSQSSQSATSQKSLDQKQPIQGRPKNVKPAAKPSSQSEKEAPLIIDSSSDWSSEEDEVDKTQMEGALSDRPISQKKLETIEIGARDKKGVKEKAVDNTESGKEKKKVKSGSESEHGGSQLLKSWSKASTNSSPIKKYTASDGRRLKQKRLEDLKDCSKISEQAEKLSSAEAEPGAGATGATSACPKGAKETQLDPDSCEDDTGSTLRESDDNYTGDNGASARDIAEEPGDVSKGSTSSGVDEILAPNSLPSDEEVAETLFQPHEEVTVVQETQELHDSSRSPSPEIPILGGQPSSPSSQPSFPAQEKKRGKVMLGSSTNFPLPPTVSDNTTKDNGKVGGEVKQRKEGKLRSTKAHSSSETDVVQSDSSARKKKKKKTKREKDGVKSNSEHTVESSDATTASGTPQESKQRKMLQSSKKKKETESPPSQDGVGEPDTEKRKRKKRRREIVVVSGSPVVPSSQTDQSESEGNLVIDCSLETEEEQFQSEKSKSSPVVPRVSRGEKETGNSSREAEVDSSVMSDSQQKRKHKKNKKTKSTRMITGQDDDTMATESQWSPAVNSLPVEGSEDVMSTDTDVVDLTSDCSVSQSQSVGKRKNKLRKRERKSQVTIKEPNRGTSPSEVGEQISRQEEEKYEDKHEEEEEKEEDEENEENKCEEEEEEDDDEEEGDVSKSKTATANTAPPSQKSAAVGDRETGFLKPKTVPPSKSSPNTPNIQLSPAARIGQSNRVSPKSAKGGNILSVFSVTETEMSSEESSSERKKVSSRAHREKKPRKFNFLSSLGPQGRKVHKARSAVPFSRSTLHTPSPSRLSSEAAVRMFSLTHSPRSSAHRAKPRPSPTKTPPTKRKQVESVGPSLDELLMEAQGREGGESKEPTMAELLADGSLWDT